MVKSVCFGIFLVIFLIFYPSCDSNKHDSTIMYKGKVECVPESFTVLLHESIGNMVLPPNTPDLSKMRKNFYKFNNMIGGLFFIKDEQNYFLLTVKKKNNNKLTPRLLMCQQGNKINMYLYKSNFEYVSVSRKEANDIFETDLHKGKTGE